MHLRGLGARRHRSTVSPSCPLLGMAGDETAAAIVAAPEMADHEVGAEDGSFGRHHGVGADRTARQDRDRSGFGGRVSGSGCGHDGSVSLAPNFRYGRNRLQNVNAGILGNSWEALGTSRLPARGCKGAMPGRRHRRSVPPRRGSSQMGSKRRPSALSCRGRRFPVRQNLQQNIFRPKLCGSMVLLFRECVTFRAIACLPRRESWS